MAVNDYEQRFALEPELRGGNADLFSLRIGSVSVQGGTSVPISTTGVTVVVGETMRASQRCCARCMRLWSLGGARRCCRSRTC